MDHLFINFLAEPQCFAFDLGDAPLRFFYLLIKVVVSGVVREIRAMLVAPITVAPCALSVPRI